MSRIRILSDSLANKIAAGEVVERPASVVKELIENSIDAGALNLRVTVQAGGKRLIQVLDDGEGMTPDDGLLAFERHATSKIQQVEDLMEIASLGFRGEALPSIAGVSRLLMETQAEGQRVGTAVEIAGPRIMRVREIARSRGTTVTVRDLFFNVPARKKFLRAERTELSHIVNVVTQYALAHPEGHFSLINTSSKLFSFQAVSQLRERLFQVFGAELLKQLVELETETPLFSNQNSSVSSPLREQIRLHAFISKPEVQKLNRNSLYFFVNRRMVRDRILMHALGEAYRRILPAGMFPVALVFIEIPFGEVDVNVHPSKTEVRFRSQSLIHDFLRESILKALMEARPQAPFLVPPQSLAVEDEAEATHEVQKGHALLVGESFSSKAGMSQYSSNRGRAVVPANQRPSLGLKTSSSVPITERLAFQDFSPVMSTPTCAASAVTPTGQQLSNRPAEWQSVPNPHIHPLGQIEDSFIVASDRGSLLIIDQHVAHERVLFEKVLHQRQAGDVQSQRLLLPLIVELTPSQQVILENIKPELTSCGFEVEPFGRRTIAIKAVPSDLTTGDLRKLLGELLEGLEKETREVNLEFLQEKIAASIACHAAIKVNTHLEYSKMVWLIDELLKTGYPMTCPHGRPIILRYEKREILKAFKRV